MPINVSYKNPTRKYITMVLKIGIIILKHVTMDILPYLKSKIVFFCFMQFVLSEHIQSGSYTRIHFKTISL